LFHAKRRLIFFGAPTRNYVQLFWNHAVLHLDDGVNQFDVDAYAVGGSVDEQSAHLKFLVDYVQALYGPSFAITTASEDPRIIYHCLDKPTLVALAQKSSLTTDYGWNLFNVPGYPDSAMTTVRQERNDEGKVQNSPRYTGWTDPQGEKHDAPPSDSKTAVKGTSPDIGAILRAWLNWAQSLIDRGLFQQGGEVLYAYRQVIGGHWSLTQAIDYILKLHIPV
jgi:hypothetical protein